MFHDIVLKVLSCTACCLNYFDYKKRKTIYENWLLHFIGAPLGQNDVNRFRVN